MSVSPHRNSEDLPFQVVVISGPSGSGKTTVVSRLEAESPIRLVKSISATTRPARVHEKDGTDYHFLNPDDFEQRRENDEFLEYAEVHRTGYWYGTLKSEVDRARSQQAWSLLEIDVEGATNVMRQYPEAVTIFITTPSEAEFERRLRARGTEADDVIERRLQTARSELISADKYRYKVINDQLDQTVAEIIQILETIATETCRNA